MILAYGFERKYNGEITAVVLSLALQQNRLIPRPHILTELI